MKLIPIFYNILTLLGIFVLIFVGIVVLEKQSTTISNQYLYCKCCENITCNHTYIENNTCIIKNGAFKTTYLSNKSDQECKMNALSVLT